MRAQGDTSLWEEISKLKLACLSIWNKKENEALALMEPVNVDDREGDGAFTVSWVHYNA